MANKRKITCDCGEDLVPQMTLFDHFETEAMVCPKGHFTTLTKEQAEEYLKLRRLHEIVDAERKIIRIGNSMGLTLPDELQTYGAKVGKRVKLEAINASSFKVELLG